uniref:Uncharacterized protein n=1 Tax=Anguilla anguilla TaxID=7936 RepID=A0A0E9USA7_ANGAN
MLLSVLQAPPSSLRNQCRLGGPTSHRKSASIGKRRGFAFIGGQPGHFGYSCPVQKKRARQ